MIEILTDTPETIGFSAGAMWEDAKVGMRHLRAFEKIAVVSGAARAPARGIRSARGGRTAAESAPPRS